MDRFFEVPRSTVQQRFKPMSQFISDNSQSLSNTTELHRLRRTVKRWSKIRWVFLLIVGGALSGMWVKTDWALFTAHTTTWTHRATPEIAKADAYIHSLF
jgi:hypothetical protein